MNCYIKLTSKHAYAIYFQLLIGHEHGVWVLENKVNYWIKILLSVFLTSLILFAYNKLVASWQNNYYFNMLQTHLVTKLWDFFPYEINTLLTPPFYYFIHCNFNLTVCHCRIVSKFVWLYNHQAHLNENKEINKSFLPTDSLLCLKKSKLLQLLDQVDEDNSATRVKLILFKFAWCW